jgi:diguanylate cyclase (GGDEF)-like protein
MSALTRGILEEVLAGAVEPVVVVRVDRPDWPVAFANPAFESLSGDDCTGKAFADVVEALGGRQMALEVSETVRSGEETSHPMEVGTRDYLLVLRPLEQGDRDASRFYVGYWRGGGNSVVADSADMHHALLKAKRRIRDLSRDDAVTGLLNAGAFREVFEHDWAVAAREKSRLSLVTFSLDDFDAYVDVFGHHAADSCLRRVGQAIRRSLRRASDVVARPGGAVFVALSHGSEEANVREFAGRIATAVRELGIHHPHSRSGRFVTISYDVTVADAAGEEQDAGSFLDALLDRVAQ